MARIFLRTSGWIALFLLCPLFIFGQEKKPVDGKEEGTKIWASANGGPSAIHESPSLTIFVPKDNSAKVKEFSADLEKHYNLAFKKLGFTAEALPWEGKALVLVFPDHQKFGSFVRRVEKRSPDKDEVSSFSFQEGLPRVVGSLTKGKEKYLPSLEVGANLAGALLQSKAGLKTPVPEWVKDGFGRAVHWRVLGSANGFTQAEHKKARDWGKGVQTAADLWSANEDKKAQILQASMLEYLAFGLPAAKLESFIKGFALDENGNMPTVEQALTAATISPTNLLSGWKVWVVSPK